MNLGLSQIEYQSVKDSYQNLLALFARMGDAKEDYIDGIFKWGEQLGFTKKGLYEIISNPETLKFREPKDRSEAIEWIYDLVYMIYMDEKVEDFELEIASEYAKKLGFKPYIVNDLMKAIATASSDGISGSEVRKEIKQIVDDNLGA